MSAVQEIEWGECLVERTTDSSVEEEFRAEGGVILAHTVLLHGAALVRRALRYGTLNQGTLLHMDLEMAKRVTMIVSQDQSCRYCYATMRAAMRFLGMNEKGVQNLNKICSPQIWLGNSG